MRVRALLLVGVLLATLAGLALASSSSVAASAPVPPTLSSSDDGGVDALRAARLESLSAALRQLASSASPSHSSEVEVDSEDLVDGRAPTASSRTLVQLADAAAEQAQAASLPASKIQAEADANVDADADVESEEAGHSALVEEDGDAAEQPAEGEASDKSSESAAEADSAADEGQASAGSTPAAAAAPASKPVDSFAQRGCSLRVGRRQHGGGFVHGGPAEQLSLGTQRPYGFVGFTAFECGQQCAAHATCQQAVHLAAAGSASPSARGACYLLNKAYATYGADKSATSVVCGATEKSPAAGQPTTTSAGAPASATAAVDPKSSPLARKRSALQKQGSADSAVLNAKMKLESKLRAQYSDKLRALELKLKAQEAELALARKSGGADAEKKTSAQAARVAKLKARLAEAGKKLRAKEDSVRALTLAQQIRAEADKKAAEIRAHAEKKAQRIKRKMKKKKKGNKGKKSKKAKGKGKRGKGKKASKKSKKADKQKKNKAAASVGDAAQNKGKADAAKNAAAAALEAKEAARQAKLRATLERSQKSNKASQPLPVKVASGNASMP